MEFQNCDQYVLDELFQAQAENERLRAHIKAMDEEIDRLNGELNKEASKLDEMVIEAGRTRLSGSMFNSYESAVNGGEVIPFDDWCIEAVCGYAFDENVGKAEAIAYFRPELEAWYKKAVERGGDAE